MQAQRSVHGVCSFQVSTGSFKGCATALGLWEALVVSIQTQVLHGHQLTLKKKKKQETLDEKSL